MKKFVVILLIFLICYIPNVGANVICNDGSVSPSCGTCGRGCCSHHGGCSGRTTSSKSSSSRSSSTDGKTSKNTTTSGSDKSTKSGSTNRKSSSTSSSKTNSIKSNDSDKNQDDDSSPIFGLIGLAGAGLCIGKVVKDKKK